MLDEEAIESLSKMLEAHAQMLKKRFDSVQIIATVIDQSATYGVQHGEGNVYARLESCAEWVRKTRKM